jgi:TorA-specific chaperone
MTSLGSLRQNQKQALLESLEKLCSIFWGPSLEKCREMPADEYLISLEVLSEFLNYNYINSIKNIKDTISGFSGAESLFNFLEATYVRLFINTLGGISAPLYHSCYLQVERTDASPVIMGETAVYMKQRFESKGLSIADTINEPPDHLSIEIEYLYFLLQNGWEKQDNNYLAEAVSFAKTFMLPWVSLFCDRLSDEQDSSFYSHAAVLLKFILSLVVRLEPE